MKNALYLLGFVTVLACSDEKKSTRSTGTDTARTTARATPDQPGSTEAKSARTKRSTAAQSAGWSYAQTGDKISGMTQKATIMSPDSLKFGFPFTDGSTATLTIRKRNGTTTVYLEVSNGQFNRSFQGGVARIRFDQKLPAAYSFSAAENGRANIIFFDDVQLLINRIKAARKMVIAVGFENQGERRIEFRTGGLRWQ